MRLGIDLDGVVFPFIDNFVEYCQLEGINVPAADTIDNWNFFEDWGYDVNWFKGLCEKGVNEGFIFGNQDPYPNSLETLSLLKGEGHSLHVITHRTFGERSIQNTADWLHEHSVPFDTVTFAEDKTFVQVDLLIDDAIKNYEASIKAGIPCILMDRPWNQNENYPRVYDWDGFESYVNNVFPLFDASEVR